MHVVQHIIYGLIFSFLPAWKTYAAPDSQLVQEAQTVMNDISSWWRAVETFLGYIHSIWHFTLFTVEEHHIELANVLITLIFLYIGFKLARYLSELVHRGMSRYTDLEPSAVDACAKISYYIFLILIALQALAVAHIPLTVFAFVGGALAIGIGFGSQNIINNFISGLIIMVERPIRMGDVIDIHDTFGRVVNIGARCTHIRQVSNIDILIPNSYILENKIVNWTLHGNNVRINIVVGVMIESHETRHIEQLILRAIDETDDIVREPKSRVFLTAFEQGCAHFEIHFWINAKDKHERRYMMSEVYHKVAEVFSKEKIPFSIPHRKLVS